MKYILSLKVLSVLVIVSMNACSQYGVQHSILESSPYMDFSSNSATLRVDGHYGRCAGLNLYYHNTTTDADTNVTGYNGTLRGAPNCCDVHDPNGFDREEHRKWSPKHEIHAEQNAIAVAAKNGIALDGCTCYCSLQPCNTCLLMLIQSGIKEIIYVEPYDRCEWTQELLDNVQRLGVVIRQA